MMKRSFLLAAALGLLSSFALTSSSQAGSVVTTTVSLGSFAPPTSTPTYTTIDYTYTGAGTITSLNAAGLAGFSSPPLTYVAVSSLKLIAPNEVALTFLSPVSIITGSFSFNSTTPFGVHESVGVTASAGKAANSYGPSVPEPASLALLGIGMTSFLAFRRLFKRAPLA
jgi:hypothetical protein